LDDNTTKVLLAAIPSGAFVIIVALVIFGLPPGDCIEIEAPGGGKIVRCKPAVDPTSVSSEQVNFFMDKINELKTLQETQQQQQLSDLKQEGMIKDIPSGFITTNSTFGAKQDKIYRQLQDLSPNEATRLIQELDSSKEQINRLNSISERLRSDGVNFSLIGKWTVIGTVGVFGLHYEGKMTFDGDMTFESEGTLDGKKVAGNGEYMVNELLGTLTLYPLDSEPTQYSFTEIKENSFTIWSPLDFEKIEFRK
jgi:hypothetical protein